MKENSLKNILRLLLLMILSFPLWYKLGNKPIHIWDEAIYANNAFDMRQNGNLIVLTNEGGNNLYNVKPPFVIILQAFCLKLFGVSEFSVRLPSLLASIGVCILLLVFAKKIFNKEEIGWIAIVFLVTLPGFSRVHVARSGDLDAVLIFFITFYTLFSFDLMFNYNLRNEKGYLFLIGLGIAFAFLSKSVAGFLPLPGLFLGFWLTNTLKRVITSRYFYFSSLIIITICGGYYLLREYLSSGYLEIVLFSEYRRFFENIMPYHEQHFSFYFRNWFHLYLIPHIFIMIPLMIYGCFFSKNKNKLRIVVLYCISYMLIISYPKVKLDWYDSPVYPVFALIAAVGFYELYNLTLLRINFRSSQLVNLLIVALFSIYPYYSIFKIINKNQELDTLEKEGAFLKKVIIERKPEENIDVFMSSRHIEHYDQARFYMKKFNAEGYHVQLKNAFPEIVTENLLIVCQKGLMDSINIQYNTLIVDSLNECKLVKLLPPKKD
ncbi:MAG: glycosyltransferase family 39 protein [Bacteroidia bacterium]|nr:glycosyltransferase family 39 protein [Bacteroidia bacterium]